MKNHFRVFNLKPAVSATLQQGIILKNKSRRPSLVNNALGSHKKLLFHFLVHTMLHCHTSCYNNEFGMNRLVLVKTKSINLV